MRVLIADDEPLEAEGLRVRLQALGHDVAAVVYDGTTAVAQAATLSPELIFLDFRLPRLDGMAAAQRILAGRRVPIVLLTGLLDAELEAQAMEVGIAGYLVKPVDQPELRQSIAKALRRMPPLPA